MKGINAVIIAVVALLLLAGASVYAHDQRVRSDAVAGQLLKESEARVKADDHRIAMDQDTLRAAKARRLSDSVKATGSVRRYADTRAGLILSDTVAVALTLDRADTAIHDMVAVGAADAVVMRWQDSTIMSMTSKSVAQNEGILALRSLIPTKSQHVLTAVKWLAVGGAVGFALHAVLR